MKNSLALLALVLFMAGVGHAQALNDPQADFPGSPEKPLTQELITKLYELNSQGQIHEAWAVLAAQQDGYAKSAAKIFGNGIAVGKCVVEENWKVVVGPEVKSRLYRAYAQFYQHSYIAFLDTKHRYPNSLEIEKLYQNADISLGLPQSISVDLLFNTVPADWKRRVFFDRLSSALGVGRLVMDKRWYHYTELSDARVVDDFITAGYLSVDDAKAIFRKTAAGVTKCMLRAVVGKGKKSSINLPVPTDEASWADETIPSEQDERLQTLMEAVSHAN